MKWRGPKHTRRVQLLYPLVVIYHHFISRAAEVESYYSPAAVKVETIKATESPKSKLLSNNHTALSFIHTALIHLSFFHPFGTFDASFFTPAPLKESIERARYVNTQYKCCVLNEGKRQYRQTAPSWHNFAFPINIKSDLQIEPFHLTQRIRQPSSSVSVFNISSFPPPRHYFMNKATKCLALYFPAH